MEANVITFRRKKVLVHKGPVSDALLEAAFSGKYHIYSLEHSEYKFDQPISIKDCVYNYYWGSIVCKTPINIERPLSEAESRRLRFNYNGVMTFEEALSKI